MTRALIVKAAGPGLLVQDLGRSGFLTFGLSRGGAADRLALFEAAALLGQEADWAALEMAATGGQFEATQDLRIALTGAPMRATLDGARLAWNASHYLPAGAVLTIGPTDCGVYGYLSIGGGLATPQQLGARSAHLAGGLGAAIAAGAQLALGPDPGGQTNLTLPAEDRFEGGLVRLVASAQTDLFAPAEIKRFEATLFRRDMRANRMGARLVSEGAGFATADALSILSEAIVPGDIQITGDGTPFVLLAECQTTGGYPRIGSVIPCDLPRIAQAAPGVPIRFAFVSLGEALEIERRAAAHRATLRSALTPLVRDPHTIRNLLSYQMISGVTDGRSV